MRDNLKQEIIPGDEVALWVYAEFEDGSIINGMGNYTSQKFLDKVAVFFTGNIKPFNQNKLVYQVNVYKKL